MLVAYLLLLVAPSEGITLKSLLSLIYIYLSLLGSVVYVLMSNTNHLELRLTVIASPYVTGFKAEHMLRYVLFVRRGVWC